MGRRGTAQGSRVAGVHRPSRPWALGQSSNPPAPAARRSKHYPKAGILELGNDLRRLEDQPWPTTVPLCVQQAEHSLLRAAGSEPESSQPSLSEFPDHKPIRSHSEMFAASVGNVDWLRFCLKAEHKEIRADEKGFTAIHFAAQKGKLPCIQVLVEEYEFPVDLLTNNHQTPLHLVIHSNNKSQILPCMDYLLRKGAAINSQTCNGSTPLHLAARDGLLGCIKFLVQHGANVHARDTMGCKPIDYCKLWNHRTCARFLKDAMWRQDKKDFAQEMGKLKQLKEKLIVLEHKYLTESQKEQRILRETDFRKWCQGKLQPLCQTMLSAESKQEAGAQPSFLALSKPRGSQFSKRLPSLCGAQLKSLFQPVVQPMPIYKEPISPPKMWNLSNNLNTYPTTNIGWPPSIRLGVHPIPIRSMTSEDSSM